MATYTATIGNVTLQSVWTNSGGKITSGPTAPGATRTITLSGVPAGIPFESAILSVTCSSTVGGAAILTVNGKTLKQNATNAIDMSATVVENGSYDLAFKFKDNGRASMSDGTHSCTMVFSAIKLTVTTAEGEGGGGDEEEDPLLEPVAVAPDNAIILHDAFDRSYTAGLGLCVLTPKSCVVTEEAGGKYALKLVHPLTDDGRWRLIEPMAIITAPVPLQDTPVVDAEDNAIVDETFDIYTVNTGGAAFYRNKNPTIYPAWSGGKWYSAGDKARYGGINYVCRTANAANPWDARYWTSKGSGAAKADRTLPAGTEITVSKITDGWAQIKDPAGTNGWVKANQITFLRQDVEYATDPEEVASRRIATQAFRVTNISVDTQAGTISVTANHISYDASATLLDGGTDVTDVAMPEAILKIRQSCIPYGADSAPTIVCQFPETKITGDWSLKPLTEAILDPEKGLVAIAKAKLVRDNEDFFVLDPAETDRGIRLRYGANLRGVKWDRDFSRIITRIVPTAKTAEGEILYLGNVKTVDSPLAGNYPFAIAEHLQVDGQVGKEKSSDDTTKWTAATLREYMEQEAQKRFEVDQVDQPKVTLKVSFTLLGDTEEYAQYKPLERLSLYDTVGVTDPTIGLDVKIQVKAYEWDAVLRRYNSITLGNVFEHERQIVAGYTLQDGSITARKLAPGLLTAL